MQCCYNEFVILRRESENELRRSQTDLISPDLLSTNSNDLKNTIEQLESTRIENREEEKNEEKETDQLPDYSSYNDDVNASMLRVLRNEEGTEEETKNQQVIFRRFLCKSLKEIHLGSND